MAANLFMTKVCHKAARCTSRIGDGIRARKAAEERADRFLGTWEAFQHGQRYAVAEALQERLELSFQSMHERPFCVEINDDGALDEVLRLDAVAMTMPYAEVSLTFEERRRVA